MGRFCFARSEQTTSSVSKVLPSTLWASVVCGGFGLPLVFSEMAVETDSLEQAGAMLRSASELADPSLSLSFAQRSTGCASCLLRRRL